MSERILPVHEVTKILRKALEKAFECKIEFANETEFFVVFYVERDDALSIRVDKDSYWLASCEKPQAPNLIKLSLAMKNVVGLAAVLQVKPRWDFEAP
jgi:hypothetical protein